MHNLNHWHVLLSSTTLFYDFLVVSDLYVKLNFNPDLSNFPVSKPIFIYPGGSKYQDSVVLFLLSIIGMQSIQRVILTN